MCLFVQFTNLNTCRTFKDSVKVLREMQNAINHCACVMIESRMLPRRCGESRPPPLQRDGAAPQAGAPDPVLSWTQLPRITSGIESAGQRDDVDNGASDLRRGFCGLIVN